jgi:hypothetical protein
MDKRISLIIMEVCQKYGIDYTSVNPQHALLINDAKRLGEIMVDLRIIAGDLEAIAERHDIDGLKSIIHQDALAIEKIDHELVKIAAQIRGNND